MQSSSSRQTFESRLQQKLPFDDEILRYLLRVVPASDSQEVLELVKDFCPAWPDELQRKFADLMLEGRQREVEPPRCPQPQAEVAQKQPDKYDVSRFLEEDDDDDEDFWRDSGNAGNQENQAEVADVNGAPPVDLAADELLARMLQDEDDQSFNQGGKQQIRGGKKKGKGYRQMPINYQVGRQAAVGTAALGTTGPSNLAELLRSRRQQEQRPISSAAHFGPSVARNGGSWAPIPQDGTGMTWAERAQVAATDTKDVDEWKEHHPKEANGYQNGSMSAVPTGPVMRLNITSNDSNQTFHVDAGVNESFGNVKARIEKLHSIPAAKQRLLYRGRELNNSEEVRQSGVQPGHPIHLALREVAPTNRPAPPSTSTPQSRQSNVQQRSPHAPGESLTIKLRLPGGVVATMSNVLASDTTLSVKQRIQQEHGIRLDHLSLLFFGYPLQDSSTLSDCGIANGAAIDVKLTPPGLVGARTSADAEKPAGGKGAEEFPRISGKGHQKGARKGNFNEFQVSEHGRVLNEEEALQKALEASQNNTGSSVGRYSIDDDDGDDGIDGDNSSEEDMSASKDTEFLVEVAMTDDKLASLISHAKRVASSMQLSQNYLERISKRSGLRLTMLCTKAKKQKSLLAYAVYRFKPKALHVLQVAVVGECRGSGYGRQMVKWFIHHAKKTNVDSILLSSLHDSVEFYQRLGFKLVPARGTAGEDYVDGQACLEYTCGRKRVKTVQAKRPDFETPGAALRISDMTRSQLVSKVFQLCDVDEDGLLTAAEMEPFARETGFDGTLQEWTSEFNTLCEENDIDSTRGLSVGLLQKLVNDESDKGCYCTDQELRDMAQKLERAASLRPRPKPKAQASAPSTQGRQESRRDQLVKDVFSLCDANRDGNLNEQEMKKFAFMTGFDGSAEDWKHEFGQLCSEYRAAAGINLSLFQKLVDDNSDSGCYCTDDELNDMLQKLRSEVAQTQSNGGYAPAPALDPSPTPERGRAGLIESVFRLCDSNGDGYLRDQEMLPFARQTGFDGSEQEWLEEYELLCRETKSDSQRGIDLSRFMMLVDDESESGCYCTDEELAAMIPALEEIQAMRFPNQHRQVISSDHELQQKQRIEADESPNVAFQPEPVALRKQAADTGGTITPKSIAEQKLQETARPTPSNTESLPGPAARPPPGLEDELQEAPPVAPASATRRALVKAAFAACDFDGDGVLSESEMLIYARHAGFDGLADDWTEEFQMLCNDCNRTVAQGIDFDVFAKLADDQSENGCYCDDQELAKLVAEQENRANDERRRIAAEQEKHASDERKRIAAEHERRASDEQRRIAAEQERRASDEQGRIAAEQERRASDEQRRRLERRALLLRSLFEKCDVDCDSCLSVMELHAFAKSTGFSGYPTDWAKEYADVCNEHRCNLYKGVDFGVFEKLLSDQSSTNYYCDINDLQQIVDQWAECKLPDRAEDIAMFGRTALVRVAFRVCDEDGDGVLSSIEMLHYARQAGFDGSEQDWWEEYQLLCSEHQRRVAEGIDFDLFVKLANDDSDTGCYCRDDELVGLISSRTNRSQPGSRPAAMEEIAPVGRDALINAVFRACDVDGDGFLNEPEMHVFSKHSGFDGSLAEWSQEYHSLCQEYARNPSHGIEPYLFSQLVNDESDNGCFCSDEELRTMVKALFSEAKQRASAKKQAGSARR